MPSSPITGRKRKRVLDGGDEEDKDDEAVRAATNSSELTIRTGQMPVQRRMTILILKTTKMMTKSIKTMIKTTLRLDRRMTTQAARKAVRGLPWTES